MAAYLILTKADRLILDSYKPVLDGFSEYFGEGYELVLHSLEDLEHSVIKIKMCIRDSWMTATYEMRPSAVNAESAKFSRARWDCSRDGLTES